MGHRHVGVDAVADHGDLVGLEAVARKNARKHVGIGLAERDVGMPSRGMPDAGADRAAVHQHRRLVGGAYAVGIGGDVGHALRHPPRRAAEPVVLQRHVERRDDYVGHVVGRIRRRFEPGGFEFRDHARRAEQEEPFGRGVVLLDVVDGRQRRRIHLLACGADAQRFEFVQVVGDGFGGVVGQERIADSQLFQPFEEGFGVGEERHAHVDRAVHVERHVSDAAQPLHQFVVCVNRAEFVECCHYFRVRLRCWNR